MPALKPELSPLLTQSVCEKLKCGKIKTVMDFIQADFVYLNKCAQISYKEILAIRKLLFAQFAAYPKTAVEMLNDMLTNRAIFSTGCPKLDELLCGGIFTGELTEIIGPVAAGKTQFCFTILIQVALINKQCALIIDTNGSISHSRIKEMAIQIDVSQKNLYEFQSSRVRCMKITDIYDLFTVLEKLRSDLTDRSEQFFFNFRLLIIDSVNPLLTSIICGCHNDANGLITHLTHLLKILSTDFHLAVIITNNSVSLENSSVKAALGGYWQHVPNTRLLITNTEHKTTKRHVTLMKSTRTATDRTIAINLSEKGFTDI